PNNLPTYPFQHHRYWLEDAAAGGEPESFGLRATQHPLLSATTTLAESDTVLLTGRLSAHSHPWAADHTVDGCSVLPATAYMELALQAGWLLGDLAVAELILDTPLLLPPEGTVDLQLTVGPSDEDDHRAFTVHAHAAEDTLDDDEPWQGSWTSHASGTLAPPSTHAPKALTSWPPTGAQAIDLDQLRGRLAGLGYDHGPAFQGLTKAWQLGDEIFAEVHAAEEASAECSRYVLHPALLATALQPLLAEADSAAQPTVWRGTALHAVGTDVLRVHATRHAEGFTLTVADRTGSPVASVDTLSLSPLTPEQLAPAGDARPDWLLGLEWPALETEADLSGTRPSGEPWALIGSGVTGLEEALGGERLPAHASVEALAEMLSGESGPVPAYAFLTASDCDTLFRDLWTWTTREETASTRLVIVTRRAVLPDPEDVQDLTSAPVWGLVRAAQAEHPGRLTLVDLDDEAASLCALPAALATEEPQLALRNGGIRIPRLCRSSSDDFPPPPEPDSAATGTLLVSGDGSLTAAVTEHLVTALGVRHVMLLGGDRDLAATLTGLGADVLTAPGCAADREAVAGALALLPAAHPLTGVLHVAAETPESLLASTAPEDFGNALRTATDAAWNLHELTLDLGLDSFLLLAPDPAGTLGGAGQATRAAVGSYLDALARYRRTLDRPGASLSWGPREGGQDRSPGGLTRFSAAQCGPVFALARRTDRACLLATRLNRSSLRSQAEGGLLAAPLRSLVSAVETAARGTGPGNGTEAAELTDTLAGRSESEQLRVLTGLIRDQVAAVLGHSSHETVDTSRAFKDLGFDSLTAVELRNRLCTATGWKLPSTLIFDYPSPESLAAFFRTRLLGSDEKVAATGAPSHHDEPIAIVAMSCRYPGEIRTPEDLWEVVASERDVISPFPTNRGWDLDRLFDPDASRAGTSYAREGGFVHDADEFDPAFFGISPREATSMDPQQRLLLETAWEAFERAGIDPSSLHGSRTGVFTGVVYTDYGSRVKLPAEMEGYLGIGSAGSIASGRISYTLGLEGPAVTVDTACSSSLVALHLAVRALRNSECDLALAGGATILANPDIFIGFSRQRGLARDSRCKAFAAAADGTAFGEGVGLLLVERLSDARRNGHQVLAVVRGTAINQDGASNGLTAPNGPSQQRVIRQALADSGLAPADVDAMEAHGTGTTLGDPIEAQALLATYGQDRPAEEPLYLGSLKSNIGHTQAAAGVAGIIKMIMAMRHELLPRTLHIDEPTPHVDWESGAVQLLDEAREWPRNGHPRRAAVSGFGMSGTNAHVVLEEAPDQPEPAVEEDPGELEPVLVGVEGQEEPDPVTADTPLAPWLLSGHTEQALRDHATRLHTYALTHTTPTELNTTAHTLTQGRTHHTHRTVIAPTDHTDLLNALHALTHNTPHPSLVQATTTEPGKTVFVFPGQGSQWHGMAHQLLTTSPTFTHHLTQACQALQPHTDHNILDLLNNPHTPPPDRVDITQPALFAVMTSLARLWQHHDIHPDAVLGHSQGEIAAAHIAGALTLNDAAKIVALRSKALLTLANTGTMASIPLPPNETQTHLTPYNDLHIAAHNGPHTTVIAGNTQQIHHLTTHLNNHNIRARTIPVDYASHTPHITPLHDTLLQLLHDITPTHSTTPFYSTLHAQPIDTTQLTAQYWYDNLRNPVQLHPTVLTLLNNGHTQFIETSPHPVLTTALQDTADTTPHTTLTTGTLRRNQGTTHRFHLSLAQLHTHGTPTNWHPPPPQPTPQNHP
ncbi:type I polyketide synthase, partial [Streptomyces iconiensis]